MTPKEKAEKLIDKYNEYIFDTALGGSNRRVKQCALIAVDEILELLPEIAFGNRVIKFYEQVKQEIEKL
jgi:hypothetical protein